MPTLSPIQRDELRTELVKRTQLGESLSPIVRDLSKKYDIHPNSVRCYMKQLKAKENARTPSPGQAPDHANDTGSQSDPHTKGNLRSQNKGHTQDRSERSRKQAFWLAVTRLTRPELKRAIQVREHLSVVEHHKQRVSELGRRAQDFIFRIALDSRRLRKMKRDMELNNKRLSQLTEEIRSEKGQMNRAARKAERFALSKK